MKDYIFVLVVCFTYGAMAISSCPDATSSLIPATNPCVQYTGRTRVLGSTVQFDWSGVEIAFQFEGTAASVVMSGGCCGQEYNVFIDEETVPTTFTITSDAQQTYKIAQNLMNKTHTVILTKRAEALYGIQTFVGVQLGGGTLQPLASPAVTRHMEIIGDSISCGYGDEGPPGCSESSSYQNVYLAYGSLTARYFGAQCYTECWSGRGVVRNYAGSSPDSPFPIFYNRTLANNPLPTWNFTLWIPDVVLINLGTNDWSTPSTLSPSVFEQAYINFVTTVQKNYGTNTQIFLVCGPIIPNQPSCPYVQTVAKSFPSGVTYIEIPDSILASTDYGCDYHPNVEGQKKMANFVIPTIANKMNWNKA